MKWETIKNKCVNIAYHELNGSNAMNSATMICLASMLDVETQSITSRQALKEVTEKIFKAIDDWDIRCYQGLHRIYPRAFPKNVTTIELSDKGWILV